MALTQGLQWIAGIPEERNYIAVRIRSTGYTIVLLLSVILFLLLGVFGDSLIDLAVMRFPIAAYAVKGVKQIKDIFLLLFATVIFSLLYRFVPGERRKISYHMPGAVSASVAWFVFSYVFSVYVDEFSSFSGMYGSLTTIVLIMLWLYFGMYIILIGSEVNHMLAEFREKP